MQKLVSRGALGGSSNELGAAYRRRVAAWVMSHGLRGRDLPGLDITSGHGVPVTVALETDDAVDDIRVELSGGVKVFVQAKHKLELRVTKDAPFFDAIDQWKRAIARGNGDTSRTVFVLAAQSGSGTIGDLRTALNRNRLEIAGAHTEPEQAALCRLRALLNDLSTDQIDHFLRSTHILILNLDPDGQGDAGVAEALLDGPVVQNKQGRRAWLALSHFASELAIMRAGAQMKDWLDALRGAGLTLVVDSQKSAASRFEATRLAELRYRQVVEMRGSSIDLRGLGCKLPPFSTEECAFRVRVATSSGLDARSESLGRGLVGAIRRRGRVLLLGLPGGGKSTALSIASARWARRQDWPLPIRVDLSALLPRMAEYSPLDNVIAVATQDLALEDRPLVRDKMVEAARAGEIAFFLDGLDETRERRLDVVRYLERLLQQVHVDAEIVVSTRDAAYAQAATLNFKELRLLPPDRDDIKGLLHFLLEKIATHSYELSPANARTWILRRTIWIDHLLDQDGRLLETPLIPIVVALLAGETDDLSQLPTSRAKILDYVINSIVGRWELQEHWRNSLQLGSLTLSEVPGALSETFAVVSYLLIDRSELAREDAIREVARRFQINWGIAAGRADAMAKISLDFWDEAGILIGSGSKPVLSARVPLLADIGAARYLERLQGEERQSALLRLVNDETSHEAANLAAGMSPSIAEDMVRHAVKSVSLDLVLLAARSICEGANVPDGSLERLVHSLREYLQATDTGKSWDVAKTIARMPVPHEQRPAVRQAFQDALSPEQALVATALGSVCWGAPDLALVREALRKGPPRVRRPFVDDAFQSLVLRSVDLLGDHPDLASDIVDGARHVSAYASDPLFSRLREMGYKDLVEEATREIRQQGVRLIKFFKANDASRDSFFQIIASIAPISHLPISERRRLDTLSDFFSALGTGEASPGEIDTALFEQPPLLTNVAQIVAKLAGLDLGIIAAEAQSILDEREQEARSELRSMLYDNPKEIRLDRWQEVDITEARDILLPLLGNRSLWLADVAARALLHAPEKNDVVRWIDARIEKLDSRNRFVSAWLVLHLDSTESRATAWSCSSDCIMRRAAAHLMTALFLTKKVTLDKIIPLMSDTDSEVRQTVLELLYKFGTREHRELLRKEIEIAAETPFGTWFCMRCGHTNDATRYSCEACRTVGPDLQKVARNLIASDLRDTADALTVDDYLDE